MGSEFWWFYDVIALAAVLICVFISGKKGWIRALVSLVSYALALIIAFAVSGSIAEGIYNSSISGSNTSKIQKCLNNEAFIQETDNYLENLSYFINADQGKITKIFEKGEDVDGELVKYINNVNGKKAAEDQILYDEVHEGFRKVLSSLLSKELSKYAAESAGQKLKDNPELMDELAPLLCDKESMRDAAKYISENLTADAYKDIVRLVSFIILFAIVFVATLFLIKAMTKDADADGIGSHVAGGFIGIFKGGVIIFVIAVMIRLYVILGSNEMLFFNHEAIDKSILFKYFYEFASKK